MSRPQGDQLFSPKNPSSLDRRDFLQMSLGSVAVASVGALPTWADAPVSTPTSETLVATLYRSLTEKQREHITFAFDHPLRQKVDNNWHITKYHNKDLFTPDQQAMVREIFLGLHSEQYAQSVLEQVSHDSGGQGLGDCAVAFFGTPGQGEGRFEFVLTGRHVTRRCDGDSVEGAAFGGPIFYGHAAASFTEKPDHPGNIYWYQAVRANEVFQMLDGKQRKQALIKKASPKERGTATVKLSGRTEGLAGIPVSELSPDQKAETRKVIADVLAPYRQRDVDETLKLIDRAGFDNLSMAFYQKDDLGDDGVWDIWRIEGPTAIMYFRGAPHVHAWIHVADRPTEKVTT